MFEVYDTKNIEVELIFIPLEIRVVELGCVFNDVFTYVILLYAIFS